MTSRCRVDQFPPILAVLVAGAAGFAMLTGVTVAGWSGAVVSNPTGTARSGALAFSHASRASTCAAGLAAPTRACPGGITPTSAVPATGSVSSSDAITNDGDLPGGRLTQSLTVSSCAPVSFASATGTEDPMLPRNTAAFQQPDTWGTATAATFSGSGYATDVAATSTGSLLGASFSLGVWFKVPTGYAQGGGLMSFSASPSNGTSAAGSPMLWMDSEGKVSFRLTGTLGISTSGTTSATYNDGAWHLAVLSVAAGAVSTPVLYVDGSTTGALGLSLLTGGIGYWHLGWADFTGVTAPPSRYLQGSLSGAFVRAATTSATTVTNLRGAVTASAYQTQVLALGGIAQLWTLGDTGTTTFTGALPSTMSSPCGRVNAAFAFTNPAASLPSQSLAALADGIPRTVAAPGGSATQTLTVRTSQGAGYTSDVAGLRLYAPVTFTVTTTPASAWRLTLSWTGPDSVFLG